MIQSKDSKSKKKGSNIDEASIFANVPNAIIHSKEVPGYVKSKSSDAPSKYFLSLHDKAR